MKPRLLAQLLLEFLYLQIMNLLDWRVTDSLAYWIGALLLIHSVDLLPRQWYYDCSDICPPGVPSSPIRTLYWNSNDRYFPQKHPNIPWMFLLRTITILSNWSLTTYSIDLTESRLSCHMRARLFIACNLNTSSIIQISYGTYKLDLISSFMKYPRSTSVRPCKPFEDIGLRE